MATKSDRGRAVANAKIDLLELHLRDATTKADKGREVAAEAKAAFKRARKNFKHARKAAKELRRKAKELKRELAKAVLARTLVAAAQAKEAAARTAMKRAAAGKPAPTVRPTAVRRARTALKSTPASNEVSAPTATLSGTEAAPENSPIMAAAPTPEAGASGGR